MIKIDYRVTDINPTKIMLIVMTLANYPFPALCAQKKVMNLVLGGETMENFKNGMKKR